jgi:hypothetical protein
LFNLPALGITGSSGSKTDDAPDPAEHLAHTWCDAVEIAHFTLDHPIPFVGCDIL